jgi:hypothetical protein
LSRLDAQGYQRVVQWLGLDAGEKLAVEGASPRRAGDGELVPYALAVRYGLAEPAGPSTVQAITGTWRPYRMWAVVLLHTWVRSEAGLPPGPIWHAEGCRPAGRRALRARDRRSGSPLNSHRSLVRAVGGSRKSGARHDGEG